MSRSWLTIGAFYAQRLVPGALAVLALPLLYEVCGAATYQRYSLCLLLGGTAALLFGNWVAQGAVRNLTGSGLDRSTWFRTLRLLLISAVLAGTVTAIGLPFASPDLALAPAGLAIVVTLLTVQAALVPILQALGHHLACLLSELFRTVGVVAFIMVLHGQMPASPIIVEIAIGVVTALAIMVLLPRFLSEIRVSRTPEDEPPLNSGRDFLQYGGPLSLYNGLSLWLQFQARASIVASSTPQAALLIMAFDMAQKIVSALSAPLIASQVPAMVIAYNADDKASLQRRIKRIQYFLWVTATLMVVGAIIGHTMNLWILRAEIVLVALVVSLLGNFLLQLAIPSQKVLEFGHHTPALAVAMAIATAAAMASHGLSPEMRHAAPGLELLIGGATLVILVLLLNRRLRSNDQRGEL